MSIFFRGISIVSSKTRKTILRDELLFALSNRFPAAKLTYFHLRDDLLTDVPDHAVRDYMANDRINELLASQFREIDEGKRMTFSPGLFVGLQGKANCAILAKHIIEKILRWDFTEAVKRLTYKSLYRNHLRSAKQCFQNLFELLVFAYPGRNLKPYYFKKYKNVWFDSSGRVKKDLVREAIQEFVSILTDPRGKYKYKLKEIPKWTSYKLFQKKILPYGANLSYMLNKCFRNSPADAIIFAYPELDLKPYYFRHVPKSYWSGKDGENHARELMNELMQKLTDQQGAYRFTRDEAFKIMKYKTYHKPLLPYGKRLGGMLQALFKNSPAKPLMLLESCDKACETCIKNNSGVCMHQDHRISQRMI